MTGRATRVTIRDVALRASVSTATVSRVLAGVGSPRPVTAAAVKSAADELGYRPSGVARSLRMQRTRTLGLIVTDIANPFFPELVKAADDRARELGYSILLGTAAYDERADDALPQPHGRPPRGRHDRRLEPALGRGLELAVDVTGPGRRRQRRAQRSRP